MPNPLQSGLSPVADTRQDPSQPQAQRGMPQQPQQQMPAPTHAQTVAALRHFREIEQELTGLLRDPDLGKSDMKSKIIDATSRLVATEIMTPAQAVSELSKVPQRPLDQRRWVMAHMQQTQNAANMVLDHHRVAFAGTPHGGGMQYDADNHQDTMNGMLSQHYGSQNGGR